MSKIDTKYNVITQTCEQFSWRIEYGNDGKNNWDVKWMDTFVTS